MEKEEPIQAVKERFIRDKTMAFYTESLLFEALTTDKKVKRNLSDVAAGLERQNWKSTVASEPLSVSEFTMTREPLLMTEPKVTLKVQLPKHQSKPKPVLP